MDEFQYKKGDRVCLLVDYPEGNPVLRTGICGTVVDSMGMLGGPSRFGVCWEVECDTSNFHSCNGNCERGYGWYVDDDMVAPVEEIPWIDLSDLI